MNLDRSLDDIISENRTSGAAGGGGGGKVGKPRGNSRAAPYKGGAAGKTCNNCGALGHLAGNCPEPNQCHCCGSTAHTVRSSHCLLLRRAS